MAYGMYRDFGDIRTTSKFQNPIEKKKEIRRVK